MMITLSLLRGFQTIRKPGKSGPAAVAFLDPGPPLRDFTKKICSKTKPSVSISRQVAHAQRILRSRFLRSQPRRIGPGSAHRARPQNAGFYLIMIMPATNLTHQEHLSSHGWSLVLAGINLREVKQRKQQLNCRMRVQRLITGNAVGRPSWRLSFLGHPGAKFFDKNEPLGKKLRKASGKTIFGQQAIY